MDGGGVFFLHFWGDQSKTDKRQRIEDFTKWTFEHNDKDAIIAFGHSHWFRNFFKTVLTGGDSCIKVTNPSFEDVVI